MKIKGKYMNFGGIEQGHYNTLHIKEERDEF